MALNALGRLEIVLRFTDRSGPGTSSAKKNIRSVETAAVGSANRMRNAFLGAFPAFLTLNIFRVMGRGLMAFLKPAIEYQDAMRRMSVFMNAGLGATEAQVETLTVKTQNYIKELSVLTGYESPKLIDAFTELSKKGMAGEEALSALIPVTQMARLANLDLAESIDVAAVLTKVWGFREDELAQRMSQLAMTAKRSRLDFDELRDVITRSTTGVKLAAPAWEDFLFFVAKTRDVAPTARIAGTQLRRAYEEITVEVDKLSARFGVSLKNMGKTEYAFRNMSEVIWEAAVKARDSNDTYKLMSDQLQIIGKRAGVPLTAMLAYANDLLEKHAGNVKAARKEYFDFRAELAGGTDTLQEMFDVYMEANFARQIDRLKVSFDNLAISIGPALLTPITRLVAGLTNLNKVLNHSRFEMRKSKEDAGFWSKTWEVLLWVLNNVAFNLGLVVTAMAVGRAGLLLLGSAFHFATASAFQNSTALAVLRGQAYLAARGLKVVTSSKYGAIAATSWYARALQMATAVQVRFGVAANVAALRVAKLAGAMRLFWRSLGLPALLMIGATMLLDWLGAFDVRMDKLEDMGDKANRTAEQRAKAFRDAGDQLGASIIEAAKYFEDVMKVKTPFFDKSLIEGIPDTITKVVSGMTDVQRKRWEPALNTMGQTVIDLTQKAADYSARMEDIPPQITQDLNVAFASLGQNLKLLATNNKKLQEVTNPLVKMQETYTQSLLNNADPQARLVNATIKASQAMEGLDPVEARKVMLEHMGRAQKELMEGFRRTERIQAKVAEIHVIRRAEKEEKEDQEAYVRRQLGILPEETGFGVDLMLKFNKLFSDVADKFGVFAVRGTKYGEARGALPAGVRGGLHYEGPSGYAMQMAMHDSEKMVSMNNYLGALVRDTKKPKEVVIRNLPTVHSEMHNSMRESEPGTREH